MLTNSAIEELYQFGGSMCATVRLKGCDFCPVGTLRLPEHECAWRHIKKSAPANLQASGRVRPAVGTGGSLLRQSTVASCEATVAVN